MSWIAREWADRYAALTTDRNFRVLNALAGYASHDGTGIRVNQETVARRIGSTDRKVRRALTELEGWFKDEEGNPVRRTPWIIRSGPGNKTARYRLNYTNLRPDPEVQNRDPEILTALLAGADNTVHPDTSVHPDSFDQQGGQNCPPEADNTVRSGRTELSTESVSESVLESVIESVGAQAEQTREASAADAAPHPRPESKPAKPKKPRKKPRHQMPEDWEPRPDVREQMTDECPDVDQDYELLQIRDCFIAKGQTSTDWNCNYRRWIREEQKKIRQGRGGRGSSGNEKSAPSFLDFINTPEDQPATNHIACEQLALDQNQEIAS